MPSTPTSLIRLFQHRAPICRALAALALVVAPLSGFAQESVLHYRAVAARLYELITHEMAEKKLPALSIALVDDQQIVWADGFGFEDPDRKIPATARTVYRVGSVSKLFTSIAVMQLAERGQIDIDAPVVRYLPEFRPQNPFDTPVTLRHLISHRSGLVREPPVGHYFDPDQPSLAQTVESLNKTSLVYEPGTLTKYSNAGIAVVGYVLEKLTGKPFEQYVQEAVLGPIGMENSSFAESAHVRQHLAKAHMWSIDGRQFTAPIFQLGTGPAGNLVSTVEDLGLMMAALFNGGEGAYGRILHPLTLAQMWVPQFAPPNQRSGFGIGFAISDFEGYLHVGHGGAVYGYATTFAMLPEEKIGVVIATTVDCANAVIDRLAKYALHLMIASREAHPPPMIALAEPVPAETAKALRGVYSDGKKSIRLSERKGDLRVDRGIRLGLNLKVLGNALIVEDRLEVGTELIVFDGAIIDGKDTLRRVVESKPAPPRKEWEGLIGEYGWDHNVLYVREKDGNLHALIEWFDDYELREVSSDVFAFPDFGLYHGEHVVFRRDARGQAAELEAAGILFKRRPRQTERIAPRTPIDELQRIARAAEPPKEEGDFVQPDLVDLQALDPTIKLDIRYASTNNFVGTAFYPMAKAYLQRPAAEALVRAHRKLLRNGYGLLIYDAYRPWYVTKMFWDVTPEDKKIFVADPAKGSRHNRGCAVDVTLYDLQSGEAVEMPSGYDEFSERAFPDYPGGTSLQRWQRELLRTAMEEEGFDVYEWEWWHFDYRDWRRYPIGTATFEEIEASRRSRQR